ncbi:MAG: hypothetical protein JWR69_2157 [Pedosphaera sp.]|nr:hypothetical protein [Pedosphaera sp.]
MWFVNNQVTKGEGKGQVRWNLNLPLRMNRLLTDSSAGFVAVQPGMSAIR